MRFILVNWCFAHEGYFGGCESFYEKLGSALKQAGHTVDYVSYATAAKRFGVEVPYGKLRLPEVEAALLIDKCLAHHSEGIIVRDAGVGGFINPPLRQVSIFENPYFTLNDELLRRGLVDTLTYNRYHDIVTFFERRTAMNSKNVAVSNFIANVEMRSLGVPCHKVISYAVDTEVFKPRPKEKTRLRAKYGVPLDEKVACWVGSTHPIKGIQVISNLISRFPNIHWVLVFKDRYGSSTSDPIDSIRRRLSVYKHWKVKGKITVLGRLQPQELTEIYPLSDFAVLPYLCEGNSQVALEVCSCNLPLVTTRTGLFWDFWDDRIGVPIDKSRDVEEYSEAISKLMNHIHTFEPRKVVLERKLDLKSWGDTWVKCLTEDVVSATHKQRPKTV